MILVHVAAVKSIKNAAVKNSIFIARFLRCFYPNIEKLYLKADKFGYPYSVCFFYVWHMRSH